MLEEQAMITFLKKFDEHPFLVKINGHEHLIGEDATYIYRKFQKGHPIKGSGHQYFSCTWRSLHGW